MTNISAKFRSNLINLDALLIRLNGGNTRKKTNKQANKIKHDATECLMAIVELCHL